MLHLIRKSLTDMWPADAPAEPLDDVLADWDRLKAAATTSRERQEIDAVFSRQVA
jgi:hypothetical protein